MIEAGRLNQLVKLQEKSVSRDAYGGEVVTWVDVVDVWAEIDPWTMRERLTLRRQQGDAVIGLKVRAPLAVSLGKRFLFEGKGYGVVDIDATSKHRGELFITATAEDSAP